MNGVEVLEESLDRSIVRELRSLGSTASEIAAQLASLGHKGTRGDSQDDPLVDFFVAAFPSLAGSYRFLVSDVAVTVTDGDLWCFEIAFPPHVSQFVRELDEGSYPALERDPGRIAVADLMVSNDGLARRPALHMMDRR